MIDYDQGSLMDQERREAAFGWMYAVQDELETRAAQRELKRAAEQRKLFSRLDAFWQADLEARK